MQDTFTISSLQEPDCSAFLQDITLVLYIDGIMLIGYSEQKVAMTLDTSIRHLCAREWERNPTEIQGPATLMKVLRVQLSEI